MSLDPTGDKSTQAQILPAKPLPETIFNPVLNSHMPPLTATKPQ